MSSNWKEAAHLIRPAVVFLIGLGLFAVARKAVIPPSFGQYGHYRAGALDDIRRKPVHFAGQETCVMCHTEQQTARNAGPHRSISCEACHGPAASHADEPGKLKPAKPEIAALCTRCHEASAAKPAWFKQVSSVTHNAGTSCEVCHQPHSPKL
ncbi:MAG: hypothetical protein HY821_18285 [Acidobacteria bacterium]|nr:hypothetical protein [Acidobacteriota bacterium]